MKFWGILPLILLFSIAVLSMGNTFTVDNSAAAYGSQNNVGISNSRKTFLGNLFVLNQLFNNNAQPSLLIEEVEFEERLGELFILDRLFRNETALLNSERTTLGDLFILDQLFPRKSAN